MDYAKPDRADTLAAQYVAGTLRGPARRRFEALLAAHPALRAAVVAWERRLMPLTGVLAEEAPPAAVWQGIERRLWPREAAAPAATAPWWRRLGVWRGAAGFATVAALGLAVLLVLPEAVQPPIVVVLEGTGQGPAGSAATPFVASLSADGRALVTRPVVPVAVAADRALELWSVPPSGAPRSLGLISPNGTTLVPRERLPQRVLRGDTAAFAVSVEPPGGSTTGQPTGPIVYMGKLQL